MTKLFPTPRTYEEARWWLGKEEVDTPWGPMPVTGLQRSGDQFALHFGREMVGRVIRPLVRWSPQDGWQHASDIRAAQWRAEFAKLPKNARELIERVLGDRLAEIPEERRREPKRLRVIAIRRLIDEGYIEARPCPRCGGSGRFSYNQIDGDRCFGCNGTGKTLPNTGDALRAAKRAGY